MKKVILFGASGNLGRAIAKEIVNMGYDLTIVVRNEEKARSLSHIIEKYVIADVCDPGTLSNICDNQEIVISSLGKSVSATDRSRPGFRQVDLIGNLNILRESKKSGAQKFIYISAFQAEKYLHLEYFRAHHEFSEHLKKSGIDYSIIKPPAIFSAFKEIMEMAKKGRLINIGPGDKKTNPIYEGDLAVICVSSINEKNSTIEAGGKVIYTRKQLNQIVQDQVGKNKKIWACPLWVFNLSLPVIRIFDTNLYDKLAFFIVVMKHDTIAPQIGERTFEEYIRQICN
jgi:uncharacterized protein YbjT (DUF2867 family)